MTKLVVKTYVHEGQGILLGWIGHNDKGQVHHYALVGLDAAGEMDMDAIVSIDIVEGSEPVYETVRAGARQLGIDLSEQEFDWADDKLQASS